MSLSAPHPRRLDAAGWLSAARRLPSPNCDARPEGTAIELIVIHNISLPPGVFDGDAVIDLFTNQLDWDAHPYYQGIRGIKVSAHFFIRRDGTLIQFVPCSAAGLARRGIELAANTNAATIFPSASSSKAPTTCRSPTPSTPALTPLVQSAEAGLSDPGGGGAQRHRAGAQDRSRPPLRMAADR